MIWKSKSCVNRQFVATQLSLAGAPGSNQGALASRLSCYRLTFAPVLLSNGERLSPGSSLGELLAQAREAARRGSGTDLAALAGILERLNGNDPQGRCK